MEPLGKNFTFQIDWDTTLRRVQRVRPPQVDQVMRTCPNCGSALQDRKCKIFCPNPQCGYYMSCGDYY